MVVVIFGSTAAPAAAAFAAASRAALSAASFAGLLAGCFGLLSASFVLRWLDGDAAAFGCSALVFAVGLMISGAAFRPAVGAAIVLAAAGGLQ
jgi:hypothetical protein